MLLQRMIKIFIYSVSKSIHSKIDGENFLLYTSGISHSMRIKGLGQSGGECGQCHLHLNTWCAFVIIFKNQFLLRGISIKNLLHTTLWIPIKK